MSIKNLFTFEVQSEFNETVDSGATILGGTIPLGLAGYFGYQRLGNGAINPLRRNNLAGVTQQLGSNLRKTSASRDKAKLKEASAALAHLQKGDLVDKLLSITDEVSAVAQGLLETLDDPNLINSHSEQILGYKEKILDIVSNEQATSVELKEVLGSVVNALVDNDPSGRGLTELGRRIGDYQGIGNLLRAPSTKFSGNNSVFDPVTNPEKMSEDASKRLKAYQDAFGNNGFTFQVMKSSAVDTGAQQFYAVVSRGTRHFDTVPLDLGGSRFMRRGQGGQTVYVTPERMGSAHVFYNKVVKNAERLGEVRQGAMGFESFEEFNLRAYKMEMQGNRRFSGSQLRETVNPYLSSFDRAGTIGGANEGLRSHLIAQALTRESVVGLYGYSSLDPKQRETIMRSIPHLSFMDPGQGADRAAEGKFGFRGVRSNRPIDQIRLPGVGGVRRPDRFDIPVVAREQQGFARDTYAIGGRRVKAGQRSFMLGGMGSESARGITGLTGTIQNLMIVDFGGGATSANTMIGAKEGGGSFYMPGSFDARFQTVYTKPLLSAQEHMQQESAFMQEVHRRTGGKMNEYATFTRAELEQYYFKKGVVLGAGPDGMQYMRIAADVESVQVALQSIDEVSQSEGSTYRRRLSVKETRRAGGGTKLFGSGGTGVKGTARQTSDKVYRQIVGEQMGVDLNLLGKVLGGDENIDKYTAATTADLYKKSPAAFERQLVSVFGILTGISDPTAAIGGSISAASGNPLRDTTLAVIREIGKNKVFRESFQDPREQATLVGRTLAGVWNNAAEGTRGEFFNKDARTRGGVQLTREDMLSELKMHFSPEQVRRITEIADTGVGFDVTNHMIGSGVNDYGVGRASVGDRFIEMAQKRMRDMGMDENAISDVLTGIYKRKVGMPAEIKAAEGLLKMGNVLHGHASVVSALPGNTKSTKTLSIEQLAQLITTEGEDAFANMLAESKEPIALDLGSAQDSAQGRAIAAQARKTFGSTVIPFVHGEAMRAIPGEATIQTTAGPERIGGDYRGAVTGFARDIANLHYQGEREDFEAAKTMRTFRKNIQSVQMTNLYGLAKGKVKGGISVLAQEYALTVDEQGRFMQEFEFGKEGRDYVAAAHKKARGSSVFFDTQAFMNQMKDFAGGTEDVGDMMERFFLANVGTDGRLVAPDQALQGVPQLAVRYPILGGGNLALTQIFRAESEIGFKEDEAFEFFKSSQSKEMQKKLSGLTNFRQLKMQMKKGAITKDDVRRGFNAMAGNLDQFKGTGSGQAYMPTQKLDVHYIDSTGSKASAKIDFGHASAGLGDFDGDHWAFFSMDKSARKKVMSTLGDKAKREMYERVNNLNKINMGLLQGEAKAGLKTHIPEGVEWETMSRVEANLLAEEASKAKVGMLDVRLLDLKKAVAMYGDDAVANQQAIDMLTVIQEHAVLKGKKLPFFMPFAEQLEKSVSSLLDSPSNIEEMEHVLRNVIFKGSQFASDEGLLVTGVGAENQQVLGKAVEGGYRLKLSDAIDTIAKAVNSAHARGQIGAPTEAMASRLINQPGASGHRAYQDVVLAGNTTQSALLQGTTEDASLTMGRAQSMLDTVISAGAKLDSKVMGIAGLGLAGSMFAMNAIGGDGYSARPIIMPGEVVNPNVGKAIENGHLFGRETSPQSMDSLRGGEGYDIMGRPINSSTTYMTGQSAYQVSGELRTSRGLAQASNYLQSFGGGHVTINDNRRPISPGYVDRMMGEY